MASNPTREKPQQHLPQQQIPPPNVFNPNYGYLSYPPPPHPPPQPGYVPSVSNAAATVPTEQQTSNYQETQVTSQQRTEGQHLQYCRPVVSQAGGTLTVEGSGSTQQAAVDPHKSQTTASEAEATPSAHNVPQPQQAYCNPYHGYQYGQPPIYPPPAHPAHSHLPNNQHNFSPTSFNFQHPHSGPNQTGSYIGNIVPNYPPPTIWNPHEQYSYTGNASQFTTPGSYSQNYQTAPVNLAVNQRSESAAATSQSLSSNSHGFNYNNYNYHTDHNQHPPNVTPYTPQIPTSQNGIPPANNQQDYAPTTYNSQNSQQPPHVANMTSSNPRFLETTPYRAQPTTSENGMTPTTPGYPLTTNSRQNNVQPTNVRNELTPGGSGFVGMTPYMPPAVTSQSGMMPTNHQQGIPQTMYNCPNNLQPSNVTNGSAPCTLGFMGTAPYTPGAVTTTPTTTQPEYPHTIYNSQNYQPFASDGSTNDQPQELNEGEMDYSSNNQNESNVVYFAGSNNARGMVATEVTKDVSEERRRAMAAYEDERLQSLYLSEGIKQRLVINPNVNIEAQVNQEYLRQCLQGGDPDQRTMARLYGSVNINAAGQTHNFANFDVSKTYDSRGYHSSGNTDAIQHSNLMRPPPPYPLPHVNRLAIDSARNEARNAEAELTESQERRMKAEEKIIAKEVGKKKMKSKSQRMSFNRREGYLRYQYCGRTTRNTQNYMNHSDEGLEEYIMQLELEEARAAEQRATEKMRIANTKLKAQLDEASRIEAAKIQHPAPPPYHQNFNPVGPPPMRPPTNRRGRQLQTYQSPGQRSTAPGHEYDNSSAVLPQPPSYPSTSRANARSQTYQAPFQMLNGEVNPPNYYQASGSTPSEFRTQHPRRTASYGQRRKSGRTYKTANQNLQYPTAPNPPQRMQPNREMPQMPQMPQMAAPTAGSQQYQWPPRNGNNAPEANPNLRGWAENTQTPVSNVYTAPEAYSGRQTRSSSRLYGGAGTVAPSGMSNPPGRPHFPTQMTPTYSGSGTQTSKKRTGASSNTMNQPAVTKLKKNDTGTQSGQADAPHTVNIDQLVPTLPPIPNRIFERCLNEMIHEAPKENRSGAEEKAETQESQSNSKALQPSTSQLETRLPSSNEDVLSERGFTEQELDKFLELHAQSLTAQITEDDFSCEMEELLMS